MIITEFDPLKGVFITTEGDVPLGNFFPVILGKRHQLSRSFDPCTACRGKCLKDVKDCTEPHVVYIALFGDRLKIGVTKEKRLSCRLKEQGADAGFSIAVVEDGERARILEQYYSRELGIPDRLSAEEIAMTMSDCSFSKIKPYIDQFKVRRIYTIRYKNSIRVKNPIRIVPRSGLKIGGNVLGNKGRIVVLSRGKISYWFSAEELVGYEAHPSEKFDAQTSLYEW